MSDAILAQEGTLVSYMDDGIMAVFGAPVPRDDHADGALAAARTMLNALEDFNAELRRAGLNPFGDTTNAAARLEAAEGHSPPAADQRCDA